MSQTKYKLPDDLKMRCISIIRGYDRMLSMYNHKREEILYSSPLPADGQPRGNISGDECFNKVQALQELESLYDTQSMRAVEQAKLHIGLDILSDYERNQLANAIWDSCIEGRNFVFEHRALSVGKTNFYERRRSFLHEIAKYMKFI